MRFRWLSLLFLFTFCNAAISKTDLIDLYNKAICNDPTYLEIVEKTLANEQNINIARSAFFPHLDLTTGPQVNRLLVSGALVGVYPPRNTIRNFDTQLTLRQTVFDFRLLARFNAAKLLSKQARSHLNAALQDLIIRITNAYLNVLRDNDFYLTAKSNERVLSRQLLNTKHLYKIGSIEVNDVELAQSAYESAHLKTLSAQSRVIDDKAYINTIVGEDVSHLAKLKENFPITSPNPKNIDAWINCAKKQNWIIKANQYALIAAREIIKRNQMEHLPTVKLQAMYEVDPYFSSASSLIYRAGSSRFKNSAVSLNVHVPIYSGGLISANINQAKHNFLKLSQRLIAAYRKTIYQTRKAYLNILIDITKIKSDKIIISSTVNSLKSIEEHYKMGDATMVDLLLQQEKVYQSRNRYAQHRYSYIKNLLLLKNSAGTLSLDDLKIINSWLC